MRFSLILKTTTCSWFIHALVILIQISVLEHRLMIVFIPGSESTSWGHQSTISTVWSVIPTDEATSLYHLLATVIRWSKLPGYPRPACTTFVPLPEPIKAVSSVLYIFILTQQAVKYCSLAPSSQALATLRNSPRPSIFEVKRIKYSISEYIIFYFLEYVNDAIYRILFVRNRIRCFNYLKSMS